jgi:antirestriction protein
MKIMFRSEYEANLVAAQLYNVENYGDSLKISDIKAFKLAASLVNIDYALEGSHCLLPFPKEERECGNDNDPKIYVACLAAYNNGHLHGLWIDATQDTEDIQNDINWMLSWSPVRDFEYCEEWAIHDYNNFANIRLTEYESLSYISQIGQILSNADDKDLMGEWIDYAKNLINNPDLDKIAEDLSSYYCGQWDSETDFILKSEIIEDYFNWSQFEKDYNFFSHHIDWDSMARELFMDDFFTIEAKTGFYVFRKYNG